MNDILARLNITDPRFAHGTDFNIRYKNSVDIPGPWLIEMHLDTGILVLTHQEERESDAYKAFNKDYVIVGTFTSFLDAAEQYNKRVRELIGINDVKAKQDKSLLCSVWSFVKKIGLPMVNKDRF